MVRGHHVSKTQLFQAGLKTRLYVGFVAVLLTSAAVVDAATSELADAAMSRNAQNVRSLLQKKADVNAPQVDGTTALHWAARYDDLDTADLLIRSGARVSSANREGVTPLQLAAMNGSAAMIDKLLKAGANPNAALTPSGDTALMMAARTGTTRRNRGVVPRR
jgi:uncharacterized protein